jgi:GntR family transcriptional repressor for pyruvate dehydrogenase complex
MPLETLSPRETAADACARSLRAVVLKSEYPAGDRLPPERQLAQTLGVNRVTVRAALAQLVSEGLLAVRQGSGYQVLKWRETAGPELWVQVAREAEPLERAELVADVLELRRALAKVVLERLAKRKPKRAELTRIEQAIDALEALVGAKARASQLAEADLEVLGAVVGATGSTALRLMLNPVAAVLKGTPGLIAAMYKRPEENAASWRALLLWLGAPSVKTVELALAALEAHDEATVAALRRLS